MTPTELKRIRVLAEAATSGPWEHRVDKEHKEQIIFSIQNGEEECLLYGNYYEANPESQPDWEFIAAANPQTILALLSKISELQTEQKPRYRPVIQAELNEVESILNSLPQEAIFARQSLEDWRQALQNELNSITNPKQTVVEAFQSLAQLSGGSWDGKPLQRCDCPCTCKPETENHND